MVNKHLAKYYREDWSEYFGLFTFIPPSNNHYDSCRYMYVDFSGSSPTLGVRMSKNFTLIYQSNIVGKIYMYTNKVYFPI